MTLTLTGQVRGGKNNICITRTGHRYPSKTFALWRDNAVRQLQGQFMETWHWKCAVEIDYTPGDLKVRDVPAIMDAIWSVLVKAGVLVDDGLIRNVTWRELPLDRKRPGVKVELRKL